ncbi:MAG: hypothetical protein VYE73_08275 [Acidobacteriota bacterium]|nr:hypothetical protein [Acidobacteriota bacterium]
MEGALASLRSALPQQVGEATRKRVWIVPVLAAATGLALSLAYRRRRRR